MKWYPCYMSAPHTYATDRLSLVLSGTWWVNSGADFDPNKHGAGSAGGFVRRIARTPHYDGVKKDTMKPAVIGLFGIALDAYLIELALFKGELQSEPSHLDEMIDALFDLDETQAGTSAHRTRATGPDCEGRAA